MQSPLTMTDEEIDAPLERAERDATILEHADERRAAVWYVRRQLDSRPRQARRDGMGPKRL